MRRRRRHGRRPHTRTRPRRTGPNGFTRLNISSHKMWEDDLDRLATLAEAQARRSR